ncbi:hypothetical protein HZB01_02620 [Candidatus Woesearchaeota archaeon]|nr:hypothetical protein [Candidatus Woesearchaeota archaeon]
MRESLGEANQELKRVDHLIYVSLKYTRTVDVIRSAVERMINAYGFIIDALIKKLKEKHVLESEPKSPAAKIDIVRTEYIKEEQIQKILDWYILLRKMLRTPFTKEEEFRRHVTMITEVEGKEYRVSIDEIVIYFQRAKDDFKWIELFLNVKKEHD